MASADEAERKPDADDREADAAADPADEPEELTAGAPEDDEEDVVDEDGSDEDEGEDEDVSDEDDSEEDGDEDASDEGEDEPDVAAAPAEASTKDKTARKRDGGMTAGQRLAAAKAAKAAKKAAKRGRSAEIVETKALKRAEAATDWAKQNRRVLIVVGVLAAAGVAIATGWSIYSEKNAKEASKVLWEAVETARADVVPEGEGANPDADEQTFPTLEARAERASARYAKVISQYPSTEAAVWAELGRGNALYELGQQEEARDAYQKALTEGGDDPVVAWRALEGIGFTYEAEEKWDEAIERFQELGTSGEGAWRDIADYHLARMYLAKDDTARAKETLRDLVDRLRGEREGQPELEYVLSQAELRLAALDPTLVPRSQPMFPGAGGGPPGGGGGGMGDMDPEQLQRILEQLQKQGLGGGAAGGGGGEPGEGAGGGE